MKKKKPSFLTVYSAAVSAFILICIVIYVVMAVMLNNYEAGAEQRRVTAANEAAAAARAEEESRAAESERVKNEAEAERIRAEEDFKQRQNAVKEAAENAAAAVKDAAKNLDGANAEAYVKSLVARLQEEGSSLLCDLCGDGISKYEKDGALAAYVDRSAGAYAYEMTSRLSAKITKGVIRFDITLDEKSKDGYIPDYSVKTASCSAALGSYTVTVPYGAALTVNGAAADDTPKTEKRSDVKDVPDALDPPKTSVYELSGFINEPSFEASLDGAELGKTKTGNEYVFTAPVSDLTDVYKEELTGRILSLMFDHTDFIAGVYKFSQIKKNLYPDTKLYTALSGFDNRWYYTYDYIQNENAKVSSFKVISDRLVSARVTYTQTLYDAEGKLLRKISMKFDVIIGCKTEPKVPDPSDTGKIYSGWVLICVDTV